MSSTVNFSKVAAVWGAVKFDGWAEGVCLTLEPMADIIDSTSGAGGEVAFVEKNDRRYKATVRLMQTAPCLALLTAQIALKQALPFGVTDLASNGTTYFGEHARCSRYPNAGFGNENSPREYQFIIAALDPVEAGYPSD